MWQVEVINEDDTFLAHGRTENSLASTVKFRHDHLLSVVHISSEKWEVLRNEVKKVRNIFLFYVEKLYLAEKLMTLVMNLSFESLLIKLFVRNDFPVPLVPIRPVVAVLRN